MMDLLHLFFRDVDTGSMNLAGVLRGFCKLQIPSQNLAKKTEKKTKSWLLGYFAHIFRPFCLVGKRTGLRFVMSSHEL